MNHVEAMKLALVALNEVLYNNGTVIAHDKHIDAIAALRQAIIEAEGEEHVNNLRQQAESQRVWAESPSCHSGGQALTNNEYEAMRKQNTLGYEKPQREWVSPCRPWQDLTEDEIDKASYGFWTDDGIQDEIAFARAIEAKLKEKNCG